MSKLRNAKGTFDKYLMFKATEEEYLEGITTPEELKTARKNISSALFYIRQDKLPVGYDLKGAHRAVEYATTMLNLVEANLQVQGVKKNKVKKFYEYTEQEVFAMDKAKLKAYGKCIASYLCNNGIDDRYEQYYDLYTRALDKVNGKISITNKTLEDILNSKMTKKEMQDAIKTLIGK